MDPSNHSHGERTGATIKALITHAEALSKLLVFEKCHVPNSFAPKSKHLRQNFQKQSTQCPNFENIKSPEAIENPTNESQILKLVCKVKDTETVRVVTLIVPSKLPSSQFAIDSESKSKQTLKKELLD